MRHFKNLELFPKIQKKKVRVFKMTNLKQVEKVVKEFNNDEMAIQKELKRIQSVKCRLKKQKGKSTYEREMT